MIDIKCDVDSSSDKEIGEKILLPHLEVLSCDNYGDIINLFDRCPLVTIMEIMHSSFLNETF
jgi:hypothetical protein